MKLLRPITLFTLTVSLVFSSAITVPLSATSHKPTLAQIEAAKKAELAKKKIADEALKRLAKARGNLKALVQLANAATAKYQQAKADLVVAEKESQAAAHFILRFIHTYIQIYNQDPQAAAQFTP
jgi:hypothetical protein